MSDPFVSTAEGVGRDRPRSAVDPTKVAEEALDPVRIRARERGIDLRVRRGPSVPRRILIDGELLRETLTALVDHALRRVDHGEIRVDLVDHAYEHVPGAHRLSISVIESGPVSASEPRLDECRRGAERLGGRLHIDVSARAGTVVILDLPVQLAPPGASDWESPVDTRSLHGRRILVADDGAEMRSLLRQTFEEAGASVTLLSSELETLPTIEHAAECGLPFDAAVLDHRFAESDAPTVVRALRNAGFDGAVVIFTSDRALGACGAGGGTGGGAGAGIGAGTDRVIEKPEGFPRLVAEVAASIAEHGRRRVRAASAPA